MYVTLVKSHFLETTKKYENVHKLLTTKNYLSLWNKEKTIFSIIFELFDTF